MKTTLKRLFSLLMVLVMLGSMLPAVYADSAPAGEPVDDAIVLTDEDYAIVNDVFAQIDAMEDAPAKKSASRTQITDAAAQIVMASENYVEGSLERNGEAFTWMTDVGIRCGYNPRMRQIRENMVAPETPEPTGVVNEPVATKGGWPSGNQVYLIGPYYNSDENFTDQYKNEAKAIAAAIGDTDGYTLYADSQATIDNVAKAVSNGAVVIFDSHGSTDYAKDTGYTDSEGNPIYECVSGANYSYLCLSTKTGLTQADYDAGAIWDGYDAYVNGAAIANHMTSNSPSGLLWMAICLGMATDSMCESMRAKGVEVVYGYSQSVSFLGDYRFEGTFWDSMCAGDNVATAISKMKNTWGNWDWSTQIAQSYGYSDGYSTISNAREDWCAFPIVVSDEDAHPGQRNDNQQGVWGACSLQTVKSTYTLYSQYNVTAKSNNNAWGAVSANGSTITASPAAGYFAQGYTVVSGTATVTQNGNTFSVQAGSDCTIQINFAAKTAVNVSFSGANVNGQTGYAGDAMSLPTAEAPEGYKFLGWMTSPLSGDTTEKPSYYTDSFVPTGNTTLYALYSYVDSTSGGGSGDYVKVTESRDDWSGEYLIVYEAASRVFDGSRTTLEAVSNYQDVTISNNTISAEEADAYKFIIAAMDGGYSIQSASGEYISGTSGSNKLNESTDASANTISIDASGNADIVSNTTHLRYNATSGQDRFRYYKSTSYSSQKAIALYVKDGTAGTTYYTSNPVKCDHSNTTEIPAVSATCTEAGYTAGVECTDCGSIISGHQVIAALGHSYDAGIVTTPATCTANGVKTFTCSACGATKIEDIPAIDHNYVDGICTGCGASEPVGPVLPKNGDQVVIYAPAYNKALSSTYTSFYNQGVDVSVANGVVTGYGDTEVWTVIENSDGTYSFAYDGQNLGMGDSYNSMPLGGVNDDWNIISLGNGLYNIQNAALGKYIEWYADKNNWSTYNSASAATDDRFQLSFYIIPGGDTEEPEVTEPEVTEPQATAPAGSVTTLQYVFSDYVAGTQYAQGENHTLDDIVTLTINGAHLNGNIRLYAGSNAVFTSTKVIDSIIVKAGNKAGTLNVYSSVNGTDWNLVAARATTTTYTDYSFDMPAGTMYVKLEAVGAQIRVSEMTIDVVEPGAIENEVIAYGMYLSDDLNMIFNVNMNEDAQLVIAVGGETYTFYSYQLSGCVDGSYDAYIPLAAAQMADEIVVKFVTDGVESDSEIYTVKEYADYILTDVNNEFTDGDKAMVRAMLNYGGAAQAYFGYNTENLVSTEFGAEDISTEDMDDMIVEDNADDISFYGASLVYHDKIAVRFYFTGDVEGKLFTVQGKEVTAMQKGDLYYVEIVDVMPYELDTQYTVATNDQSLSVTYGPLNYIARMYEKGDTKTQNLMKALYNYYLVALDYVTA